MELPPEKTLFYVQPLHLRKIAKSAVDDLTKLHHDALSYFKRTIE
tara:strand:- start:190 stop:324 length:135 start_codon:yes stop_codon:yes gene_type:complete